MKRVFTLVCLTLVLSSCYKDQLRGVHEQITEIRDVQIASLKQQAEQVSGSIEDLKTMTADLKVYIKQLEDFGTDVQGKLDQTTLNLEAFKASAGQDITSSQKEMMDLIDKMNAALISKTVEINTVLESLKEKDAAIEGQISSLKTYMDDLYARQDWANATLATLAKQNEIILEVESIKSQVETLEKSIKTLEESLKQELQTSLSQLKEQFNADLAAQAENITAAYEKAITEMSSKVISQYGSAIHSSIDECETALKTWVNRKLTEYYTVAQAEAQIAAFKLLLGNVPEGKNLQGELEDLQKDLEEAEITLTEAYEKAITEAIQKYEGRISDEMDRQLQLIENNELQALSNRLVPIEESITELWKEAAELDKCINTVSEQAQSIATSIAVLQELNKTLEEYVGDIKAKLEKADSDNRKELEDQLAELRKVIASLQEQITSLESYVGTLPDDVETDVTTWIQTTFNTLNSQFDSYATIVSVDEIVKNIQDRIDGHDADIKALNTALDELVDKARETIEGWIADKLKAYTTAADADVLLSVMEGELNQLFTSGDQELQGKIDNLKTQLSDMKARVKTGYETLISTSIATEQGTLTSTIKTEADKINDNISSLLGKSEKIQFSIDSLSKVVTSLNKSVSDQKAELEELEKFLAANDYKSLDAVVKDLLSKIADLKNQYADKQELDDTYAYVKGDLKTQSDRIAALVGRMKDVTTSVSKLSAFLKGTELSEGALKTSLDEIIGKIQQLESIVGTGSSSLESQLSALEVGLYGPAKDPENPSEGSICYMVNTLTNFLITSTFSSITYVPRYLDQSEKLNYSKTVGATASFTFLVRPASIARFVGTSKYGSAFQMKFVKDGTLYNFEHQELSSSEDGTIIVDVRDSRYDLLKKGASAALYVTSPDDTLPSFTSKFIPIQDINGTDDFYSSVGNLHYTSDGGSKIVNITSKEKFKIVSKPDWITMPDYDDYDWYDWELVRCYSSCPSGKDFTISADNNSTFNSRNGNIVLQSTDEEYELIIHVEQDGNLVLFSDIPAAGGTFSDNKYSFTLTNNDDLYSYIYISEREGALFEEIFGYYIDVQYYDSASDSWKDFPTSKKEAIEMKQIRITLDASKFYYLLSEMSDDTRLTFTTLFDNEEDALEGSSLSFVITRYHTLFVSDHNQTIR